MNLSNSLEGFNSKCASILSLGWVQFLTDKKIQALSQYLVWSITLSLSERPTPSVVGYAYNSI